MAKALPAVSFEKGFKIPQETPWSPQDAADEEAEKPHYIIPPSTELVTSTKHNDLGINTIRDFPTMYWGTNSPHGVPDWFKPKSEIDVLICGAGPSGLEIAVSLARQGVSFRIVDKAETPLVAGRADGVQPRFLELLSTLGLHKEVAEEGPLIERTAIYHNGKKLLYGRSHQSDSRYRGLHIITQGQVERIYVRDLLRHRQLVERCTTVKDFDIAPESAGEERPITATLRNEKTGKEETVKAKFLVGSDGATSATRKALNIPFDGVSTDIYWGIMDCVFKSDYPHAWTFGSVVSTEHGGCVIIPREDGYIRLYTQLDLSATGEIAKGRQTSDESFVEAGGKVDITSVTPEDVLAQANKIFAPYKLEFAAPLSWFACWKISERVARKFSSDDSRVHLVGDAAHVHSVMGAFGLNASIIDATNLAWKLGLAARGIADIKSIGPTYDKERRLHAMRIIQVSGSYLRFVCNSDFPLADYKNLGGDIGIDMSFGEPPPAGDKWEDGLEFVSRFFRNNGTFLLGVDAGYNATVAAPQGPQDRKDRAITPLNGVRAPNARVCFSTAKTGYMYDSMKGPDRFHIAVFGSDLQGPIKSKIASFCSAISDPSSFYQRYGGKARFNVLLIIKALPDEGDAMLADPAFEFLKNEATVLFDDRAPDEDAHYFYGASHKRGAVVVTRPDLWIGTSAFPEEISKLESYFDGFLVDLKGATL